VCTSGCSRFGHGERDGVDLGQNVTVNSKPLDPVFKDFSNTWRQFISSSPELALAVAEGGKRETTPPEPITFSECVFSPDARGYVPQVTITWNEMSEKVTSGPATPGPAIKASAAVAQQPPLRRFDLGLHHDPFARNFYSSAFSTDQYKRFSLPSNSALVNNPEAVLLTGPGLFPKLMDYKSVSLQDPATNLPFTKQTLVVRELSEGISNTMRVSHLVGNEWTTDREFIFLAPVCPVSF